MSVWLPHVKIVKLKLSPCLFCRGSRLAERMLATDCRSTDMVQSLAVWTVVEAVEGEGEERERR